MTEVLRKLSTPANYTVEIKQSKFIVNAAKVENLSQTLEFFEAVADHSANHNCWAYRIGQKYRFSDDGEPASTAGKPILAAIDGQNFDQTMIIVTRHFGGIKLGVGGLIRAYGGCSARCLQSASSEVIIVLKRAVIRSPFTHTGTIHNLLAQFQASLLNEAFESDGLVITLEIAEKSWPEMVRKLQNTTRGQATIRPLLG